MADPMTPTKPFDLAGLRRLANGEHPYGSGPWDSDHIELFQGDARALVTELERLRGIEQRAKNATHAAVVADMPALQAVWRAAHYILSGEGA